MRQLSPARRRANIIRRLRALKGKTPKGIARFLASKGITGEKAKGHSCPIANYLNYGCRVDEADITFDDENPDDYEPIRTPRNVGNFIEAFDDSKFPELERGHTDA